MTFGTFKAKNRKCSVCAKTFLKTSPDHTVCNYLCAITKLKEAKQKKAFKEYRAARERIKTKGDHAKDTQAVINRYVRLRDAILGCVSCDKPSTWQGQWHASHFRSRGAAPHLRFNLNNIHKSCSVCNNHMSGNIGGYRPALIEKIGQAKVDWLECNQDAVRHDIPYLKRLRAVFAKKIKRISAGRTA